jgi:hypothetical protein
MGKLRKLATGYQWEKIPNDVRVAMLEEDARVEALEARIAKADALAEALYPFCFFDPDEPDATSDTTQKAWELCYQDRFKDWIDFGDIEDARNALIAYREGGE